MKIDLMSISGHKIYGPKGVGAIYIRRRPRVRVEALQSGGGRSGVCGLGTVPTPLVVGLGAACEVAQQEMEYDHKRISKLAERLIQKIMKSLPDVVMNGDPEHHYPGCINLSFAYVEGKSANGTQGCRLILRECLHLCILGTFLCPSSNWH